MVGKITRSRQRLHQGAVHMEGRNPISLKLDVQLNREPARPEPHGKAGNNAKDGETFTFPRGIFAGTKITPEALVQTLKYDETSAVRTAERQKGGGKRMHQSKKDKMKERRERWLNKINAIKLAREQQVALARRKATPVVGDMKPLADALPELCQLLPSVRAHAPISGLRKQRGAVKKKAEPTDYCQMKPAQKRKLLEVEASRFSEAVKDPTFKANPLVAIGEHLRKRLRQEDEQS
ncbi:protein FAM207A isoform X2 [Electrophorus electricus]|uniref:protein FAM207A isoform X2 n=1 Tax=Electrophorus electricus TaxID=8005 RepID=UPI0015D04889|nr:protein FAM207A isoform X2 [Electrophorus electricus]